MPGTGEEWDPNAFLDEARADDRRAARARERWLRRQAEEEATMAGTLLDLAERASPVVLGTTAGRRVQGRLVAVGADVCLVASPGGGRTWVRLGGVATVRPAGAGAAPATGRRAHPTDVRLVDVLADLAADRLPVVVATSGGELVAGELLAVGSDVATIRLEGARLEGARLEGAPGELCYLALGAIDAVTVGTR